VPLGTVTKLDLEPSKLDKLLATGGQTKTLPLSEAATLKPVSTCGSRFCP